MDLKKIKFKHVLKDVPIGTILIYSGSTAPNTEEGTHARAYLKTRGYLVCDGAQADSSEYPELFEILKSYYGKASSDLTFCLPDLRGVFLRGADNGRCLDPDRDVRNFPGYTGSAGSRVGSMQPDSFRTHNHVNGFEHWRNIMGSIGGGDKPILNYGSNPYYTGDAGGAETRPVNLYVNYIIKAFYAIVEETLEEVHME